MDSLKAEHDRLLAEKPDGVEHNADECVFCSEIDPPEGGVMNTYTEDELTSAVKEALAPVQAELDALRSSLAEEEVENRIATARSEADAQVAELQAQLDAAEIRVTEAERARDEVLAWLETTAREAAEAAELQARRDARLEVVKEFASFSDEHIESHLDRWVAMDDEAFELLVEDWKAVQKAARTVESDLPVNLPAETAMSHTRVSTNGTSAVAEVFGLMRDGVDPRTLS